MYQRVIALIVLILFPVAGLPAALQIQVLQKGSGDPVANATVVDATSGEFAETDEQGLASLDDIQLPGEFKILNPGYQTLLTRLETKNIDQKTGRVRIYLEPLAFEGEALVITADRVREKTSKVVLDVEELRRAPGTQGDPLKAIQSLPGVVTAQEGTGLMYVRGSEPNQSIVWANRGRLGYLYHFGGLHSTISPQLVQDFNMFLGGFPVEYGDAMGGALDITLRKPRNDRLHQSYSFGTYESSLVWEGPLLKKNGADSGYFSARRSYVDALLNPQQFTDFAGMGDEGDAITTVPVFHDINAVWHHQLEKGDVRLQYFRAADSITINLNSVADTDPELVGSLSSAMDYDSLSLVWMQNWTPRLKTASSLYALKMHQEISMGSDPVSGTPYRMNIDELDYVWQPEISYTFAENQELVLGAEGVLANTPVDAYIARPPQLSEQDYNLTSMEKFRIDRTYKTGIGALYAKWYGTFFDRLKLQLGGRVTHLRSNAREPESIFSPRSSFELDLSKATTLTGAWGRYGQFPDGVQWVEDAGNPRLHETRSEHRILGLRHRVNELWNMQIEGYHIPMWDLIKINNNQSPPDNYSNDGIGQSYGFDVLVKRESSGGTMGWLSYSYLRTERTFDGVTLPYDGDQRHSLTAVWSQKLPGFMNKWSLGLRSRLYSGKPYTPVLTRTALCSGGSGVADCADQSLGSDNPDFAYWRADYAQKNSSRLPLFYQLDLRLDRHFLFNNWKMNMYIDILNVLNTKNVTGYDYGSRFENIDTPKKITSAPILPSFGLEIEI
ncbi:MAG: hypothetical protein OEZ43_20610 [Gammaproteobacteria bacterium]|nr:hypothetical protein [Gammaproteobacteria bacterium]